MVTITKINKNQIEEAKRVISQVAIEVWQLNVSPEAFEKEREDDGNFKDFANLESEYFNRGTFLVLMDDQKVVGTGALREFDQEICELRRMFILKEYRGHGYGLKLAQRLIDSAKIFGYKRICLEVYYPEKQGGAIRFYKQLGFYEIEHYRNSQAQLSMEKLL